MLHCRQSQNLTLFLTLELETGLTAQKELRRYGIGPSHERDSHQVVRRLDFTA